MYDDSHALSSDSTHNKLPSNSQPKQELEQKNREHQFLLMESDSSTNYSQNNSGLLRFRSAPSSLLEDFVSGVEKSDKRLSLSRFCGDEEENNNNFDKIVGNSGDSNIKSGVSRIGDVNSQLPPQYPRQNGGQFGYFDMNSSMGMDHHQEQSKIGSGLMRQNSSPAGLFSHFNSHNGYAATRGIGSYRMSEVGDNGEISPFPNRFKNQTNFSSPMMSSSLGMLSRINEVEYENGGANSLNDPKVGNTDHLFYSPGFQYGSWNSSPNFAEKFSSGVKRELDDDQQIFGDTQMSEPGGQQNILSRHLSLPNTSSELATMEKLLQFQDTVPCKLRAKRGCATHPRSIAERVRRTRISERMRKLQNLVPNMDKQTNTADMLDLAVEHIKNLQKQYKMLSEIRANCKCSASQKAALDEQ